MCCDMSLNDTIGKIELNPSSVLSSDNTNCQNDIQQFWQQTEKLRGNGETNSHYKLLGVKQTVEWQFTH